MAAPKVPVTPAVRALRAAGVAFRDHLYPYIEGGGTAQVARLLEVDEHHVIKTLVMQDEQARALIVLMHGDRQVATQALARALGVKRIEPCPPQIAERQTGYRVGGTSPFGTRRTLPIHAQASIAQLPRIYINGGKRGYILELATADLLRILTPTLVEMATPAKRVESIAELGAPKASGAVR